MASEGDSQMMATAVAEVSSFSAFLDKVVSVFFEDEGSDNFDQTLKEKSSGECMKKFLSDPQIQALFVQKAAVVKGQFFIRLFAKSGKKFKFFCLFALTNE